jgi:hypothetical protein
MAKVQRHLSIHFNTRFFKGINHEEILSGIEKKVELDNVGSVQFTETDCIISVKDLNTKEKLISGGIKLKNRSVNFLDVEKTITNVTIKDAPYEVSDCYIATCFLVLFHRILIFPSYSNPSLKLYSQFP